MGQLGYLLRPELCETFVEGATQPTELMSNFPVVIPNKHTYYIIDTSHELLYAADAHICAFSLATHIANLFTIVTCLSGVCMTDLFPLLTLCLCFFPVAQ